MTLDSHPQTADTMGMSTVSFTYIRNPNRSVASFAAKPWLEKLANSGLGLGGYWGLNPPGGPGPREGSVGPPSTPGRGGGGGRGLDRTLAHTLTMARMVSATSCPRGMDMPASCKQRMMVARQSTGRVCLGTESSFRGPGHITTGIIICRNLTVAATNISACSLILSTNHFSRLRYYLLLASIPRSITKGKGCPLSIMLRAFRSWATSGIRDNLECSLSPS